MKQFRKHALLATAIGLSLCTGLTAETQREPKRHDLAARETLTVVALNHDDGIRFRLKSGEIRTFTLEDTSAQIIERNRGGIVYSFDCQMRADGQPLSLRRYVCSQETFYEPWVINGVRLWLSSSQSVFNLVPIRYPEFHHKMDSDLIIALQDATLPICPQPMQPWFPIKEHFIDVGRCYNGDDPWLGPYLGQACHVGLDINMPKGTPLFAPIDFDDQWIFSDVHRWRGVRRWPNGDYWGLQSHHVDKLLVKEHTRLKAGTHYAEGAGKGVGSHQHSHFEFRIGPDVRNRGRLGGIEIDPWILFWQIFETDKAQDDHLGVEIDPVAPARTGQPVRFRSRNSSEGSHYWTFGDGGWSNQPAPEHTFVRPGVYPVTLIVDDGRNRATQTQHITITGPAIDEPALTLQAADNVTFRPRPVPVADVYGWPVKFLPHTVRFTAIPSLDKSSASKISRQILLRNSGGGKLPPADAPKIEYLGKQTGWLDLVRETQDNGQQLVVTADSHSLPAGSYSAVVTVRCPGAINSLQGFCVELRVRATPSTSEIIVDDRDENFYATPYFWVGHQFFRSKERGYRDRYLTNGGRATEGEFVRFTPDLAGGRYEVLLHEQTPLPPNARVSVRIRHAAGEKKFQFGPQTNSSRSLGTYKFDPGTEGFVEFHAGDSEGLIVADALVFRRLPR